MTTPRKTSTPTLVSALRILAGEIESPDGVANMTIAEGADRIEELAAELCARIAEMKAKIERIDSERERFRLSATERRALRTEVETALGIDSKAPDDADTSLRKALATIAELQKDRERLDFIERMIRAGRYNAATGRTELTAINCHLVCRDGIRAVVDLAIKEGRAPSNGGAS